MSTSSLQDTVASIGFAKVIVALKGVPAGAAAASAQTKSSIENHFMIPNLAQAESLAPDQAPAIEYSNLRSGHMGRIESFPGKRFRLRRRDRRTVQTANRGRRWDLCS